MKLEVLQHMKEIHGAVMEKNPKKLKDAMLSFYKVYIKYEKERVNFRDEHGISQHTSIIHIWGNPSIRLLSAGHRAGKIFTSELIYDALETVFGDHHYAYMIDRLLVGESDDYLMSDF